MQKFLSITVIFVIIFSDGVNFKVDMPNLIDPTIGGFLLGTKNAQVPERVDALVRDSSTRIFAGWPNLFQ